MRRSSGKDAKREVREVLDLACGTGIPTVELANRGYNVVGIDLHEEMLEVARRKTGKVKFIQGNALEINFREEFDAVMMLFSSITYFNEEELMILFRKVHEALRPGGVFIADFSPVVRGEESRPLRVGRGSWRREAYNHGLEGGFAWSAEG
ncbi:class I SAM-dependent methyltransferase [Pyrococcus kukulkanii]|uniref:class I SAM-dependent methyltransferase n=1 Tax=Pyrococcus kukulkanii TaxID=1609559 RepID=UPI00356711C2